MRRRVLSFLQFLSPFLLLSLLLLLSSFLLSATTFPDQARYREFPASPMAAQAALLRRRRPTRMRNCTLRCPGRNPPPTPARSASAHRTICLAACLGRS